MKQNKKEQGDWEGKTEKEARDSFEDYVRAGTLEEVEQIMRDTLSADTLKSHKEINKLYLRLSNLRKKHGSIETKKKISKFRGEELKEGIEKALAEKIKKIEKLKEWSEPQSGAGEGLGALAGTGMYLQYDQDRKKHKEQIDQILSILKKTTMSADNLVRIKLKRNGLYQVRHESASSLAHALAGVEPTEEELLLEIVADDIKGHSNALKKATKFVERVENKGGEVEYGIQDENWKKSKTND